VQTFAGSAGIPACNERRFRREPARTRQRALRLPQQCFLLETGIIIIRRNFIQLRLEKVRTGSRSDRFAARKIQL